MPDGVVVKEPIEWLVKECGGGRKRSCHIAVILIPSQVWRHPLTPFPAAMLPRAALSSVGLSRGGV